MGKSITSNNLQQNNFIALPIALFVQEKYKKLQTNDRVIYARLFNKIQLSAMNATSFSRSGKLFCYITQEKIANDLNISSRTVRNSLGRLELAGLIEREEEFDGIQRKHRIFVNHPDEGSSSFYRQETDSVH